MNRAKRLIKELMKGIIIGVANIIPGVSGGTMAVSMGIYDKLISAITNIFKDFKNSIKTLCPYLAGMLLGIVGLSFVIEWLFGHYPFQTNMLFIGLIVGCLPIIVKKVKGKKFNAGYALAFALFFLLVIGMTWFGNTSGRQVELKTGILDGLILAAVGLIASATMVIPGVSGSMVLTIMGYYMPVVKEINQFILSVTGGNAAGILHGLGILVPFGIGVVLGIFLIAKLIEFIFSKAETAAYYAILGLIIASPIAILMKSDLAGLSVLPVVTGIAALCAGLFVAGKLGE